MISDLARYKDIIIYRTLANLKSESRNNYMGYLWFLLEPMLNTAIFYLVFGVLMGNKGPDFVAFLLIGITAWQWFEAGINEGMNGISSKIHIMREIPLPKYLFPIVNVMTVTLKFLFVLAVLIGFSLIFGFFPNKFYLLLPLVILTQFILIAGIAIVAALLVAYFSDSAKIIQAVLRVLFYASGIFFATDKIPSHLKPLFYINPMAGLMNAFRDIILFSKMPNTLHLAYALCVGLTLFSIGIWLCSKVDKELLKTATA
jgi:lipopolysaccharide transport system permease protein